LRVVLQLAFRKRNHDLRHVHLSGDLNVLPGYRHRPVRRTHRQ
jgi:hypothetical protein